MEQPEEKSQPSFEGQRLDEDVIKMWRQHPWVMAKSGIIIVAIMFVSCLPLLLPGGFTGYKLIMTGGIISLIIALVRFYMWRTTVYILSSQRVIGIDQSNVLSREVHEVPLENIQNLTFVKKGVGAMVFDFGTLKIQTGGSRVAMKITNVENPLRVQQTITDAERQNKKLAHNS